MFFAQKASFPATRFRNEFSAGDFSKQLNLFPAVNEKEDACQHSDNAGYDHYMPEERHLDAEQRQSKEKQRQADEQQRQRA